MKNILEQNDLFIFDLDGTLVDTSPDIIESVRHALKEMNLPSRSDRDIRESIGGGAKVIIEKNIPMDKQHLVENGVQLFREHYDQYCTVSSKLYPFAFELIQSLKSNNKLIAVFTFKTKDATLKILKDYGILDYIDLVITKDDVKVSKPHPEGIHIIQNRLNYHDHRRIVMIGDTSFDIEVGKNAKTNTIAVTYGYEPDIEKTSPYADHYIDSLAELLDTPPKEKTK